MVFKVLNIKVLICALVVLVVRFFVNEILSSFCHYRVYAIGEKELISLSLTRKNMCIVKNTNVFSNLNKQVK
jgi:hypothetical protein